MRLKLCVFSHSYSQQTGIVQHLNNFANTLQFLRRNVKPVIEGERQFGSHIFARDLLDVDERLQQYLRMGRKLVMFIQPKVRLCSHICGSWR